MTSMTPKQLNSFLQAPRHAIVGTNRPDGPPQLSPVWYLYDDGLVYISILTDTAKYRHLQRDRRIGICIDGCHPDARAVMIYGTVSFLVKGHETEARMRRRIIRHYHETEAEAQAYAERSKDWDFVLLVVTPEKIISQDFN